MVKTLRNILFLAISISAVSCRKLYTPDISAAASGYLVVDGMINLTDSTFVMLSRTVNLSSTSTSNPELKAVVTIESGKGGTYPLTEKGKGVYAAAPLNLSSSDTYRLRIVTAAHSTYTSDFVAAKVTPPIDSLITRVQDDGVHLSINAHDATNNTQYYRWDTAETWTFDSYFQSFYYWDGMSFVYRTAQIHHCWGNFNSTASLLASTVMLSKDVVSDRPIDFIEASSEKLHERFSILIKQYALTKDAYDTKLKNNTEDLGEVFNAQPSSLTGNLHNVIDASEPVIGFISAGTISQTRIFIDNSALPAAYNVAYNTATPYTAITCPLFTPLPEFYNDLFNLKNPYNVPIQPGVGSWPLCVDCTLRGTNVQPAFWK